MCGQGFVEAFLSARGEPGPEFCSLLKLPTPAKRQRLDISDLRTCKALQGCGVPLSVGDGRVCRHVCVPPYGKLIMVFECRNL